MAVEQRQRAGNTGTSRTGDLAALTIGGGTALVALIALFVQNDQLRGVAKTVLWIALLAGVAVAVWGGRTLLRSGNLPFGRARLGPPEAPGGGGQDGGGGPPWQNPKVWASAVACVLGAIGLLITRISPHVDPDCTAVKVNVHAAAHRVKFDDRSVEATDCGINTLIEHWNKAGHKKQHSKKHR